MILSYEINASTERRDGDGLDQTCPDRAIPRQNREIRQNFNSNSKLTSCRQPMRFPQWTESTIPQDHHVPHSDEEMKITWINPNIFMDILIIYDIKLSSLRILS